MGPSVMHATTTVHSLFLLPIQARIDNRFGGNRRRRVCFSLLFLLVPLFALPLGAQNVEVCRHLEVPVPPQDELTVDDDIVIAELNISLEITTAWVGDFSDISLRSPSNTTVQLHRSGGSYSSDMDCVYSDLGRFNDGVAPESGPGVPSVYACRGCLWTPMGSSPGEIGALSDFDGESAEGEWVLEFTTADTESTLDAWCVLAYGVEPVSDLVCSSPSTGLFSIAFTNGSDYDEIQIFAGGALFVTLDDGPYLAGETVEVDSDEELATPQTTEVRVVGVVGGDESVHHSCRVSLPLDATLELSATPDATIESTTPTTVTLSFDPDSEDMTVEDLQVDLDLDYPDVADLEVTLTSSSDTTVTLHDRRPSSTGDLRLIYWQLGAENSEPFDCACVMQATGPGSLADFFGEETVSEDDDGDWVVRVTTDGADEGTFNEVVLRIYDEGPPASPQNIVCENGLDPGSLEVSWENAADYDEVRILIDGLLVETLTDGPYLAGEAATYTTAVLSRVPDRVNVSVIGVDAGGQPSGERECRVAVRIPPVTSLVCMEDGSGAVDLTWENSTSYDEIAVFVDGDRVLDLAGDATSTTVPGPFPNASTNISVEPQILGVGTAIAARCTVLVPEVPDLEMCESPSDTVSTATVAAALFIEQVEVLVEATSDTLEDDELDLTSPDGTVVGLLIGTGIGTSEELSVIFSDDGIEYDPFQFDCECLMKPSSPGFLSDFDRALADGDWTLELTTDSTTAVIGEWCLRLEGCALVPPSDFACSETDVGELSLLWTNEAAYESLTIVENGLEIAVLDGDAESYTRPGIAAGRYHYEVRVTSDDVECFSRSVCFLGVGFEEFCIEEDVTVDGEFESSILVLDPVQVGQVEVVFEWTSSPPIPMIPSGGALQSPSGTWVGLWDDSIFLDDELRMDVVFSDEGGPNVPPYDCDGCLKYPEGPGRLADFRGEVADGDWTLAMASISPDIGTLRQWCVAIYDGCPTNPPSPPTCEEEDSSVRLSWTNNDPYEQITIVRNDEEIATLAGDATEFVDSTALGGDLAYRIRGFDSDLDCMTTSSACSLSIGVSELCREDVGEFSLDNPLQDDLDLTDFQPVEDLRVRVELTHPFVGRLEVDLANPSGGEIRLHDREIFTSNPENLTALYADAGRPVSILTDLDCDCEIRPSGPGKLADVTKGDPQGNWTLTVTQAFGVGEGTLDRWCLFAFDACPIERPENLTCETDDGRAPVRLAWENSDEEEYDQIFVLRDSVIIAELNGSTQKYVDIFVPGGPHEYQVLAVSDGDECARPSPTCEVSVGRVSVCSVPDLAVPDDGTPESTTLAWEDESLALADAAGEDRVDIAEAEVHLEITTVFLADVAFSVESAEGTHVQLLDHDEAYLPTGLAVAFSDDGSSTAALYKLGRCECSIAPAGPGTFADFIDEDAQGTWTLTGESQAEATIEEWCVIIVADDVLMPPEGPEFIRGDVDGNGTVMALIDALRCLEFAFNSGATPPCLKAADVDGNDSVLCLVDALALLLFAFSSGDPPALPYPDCGFDVGGLSTSLSCEDPPVGCP